MSSAVLKNSSHCAVALACSALVSACGGGGGDSPAAVTPPPPAVAVSIADELQAKKLVARTVIGADRFDVLSSTLAARALDLVLLLPAGQLSGSGSCDGNVGSASYTFVDADRNNDLSTGDYATATLTGCQIDDFEPFTGTVRVDVTAATNAWGLYLEGAAGSLGLRVTYSGLTQPAIGLSLTGTYLASITKATSTSDVLVTAQFPSVNATTTGGLALSFTNYSSAAVFGETSSTLNTLSGSVTTGINGLGSLQYDLSLVQPITPAFGSGQARMSNADNSLLVTFSAGGVVNIKVDNGRNGSNEFDISTTITELESLLLTP